MMYALCMTERHTVLAFSKALAELMRARDIDQPRLAALAELSQSSISRYLDDLRKPSPASMEAIAAALEISPDYFLEYRIWKIQEIMGERPELVSGVYDELVLRATEEKAKGVKKESPGKDAR